jgi:hypothetical protein
MMKNRLWAVVAVSTFTAITLAGMMLVNSSLVRAQNGDTQGTESKIRLGFAIAPVPLNLIGKDRALVGLGSYIVGLQRVPHPQSRSRVHAHGKSISAFATLQRKGNTGPVALSRGRPRFRSTPRRPR